MVNIYNPEAIDAWLLKQADNDHEVALWLSISLKKSIQNRRSNIQELVKLPDHPPKWLIHQWDASREGCYEFSPDNELAIKVAHIKDWLIAARVNNEGFLTDLDGKGRPKKLIGHTLTSASSAADEYMKQFNKRQLGAENAGDTKLVHQYSDGMQIVELLTVNSLKYEGKEMGHCIGGGAYDKKLNSRKYAYFSLRDKDNNPHATLEVSHKMKCGIFKCEIGHMLMQSMGKENKEPINKYRAYIADFAMKQGWVAFPLLHANYCNLTEINGTTYNINDLPDGLTVNQSTTLMFSCYDSLVKLPKNFTVKGLGDLDLSGCAALVHLPEGLSARKIRLDHCISLETLPEDLVADEIIIDGETFHDIDAAKIRIEELHEAWQKNHPVLVKTARQTISRTLNALGILSDKPAHNKTNQGCALELSL